MPRILFAEHAHYRDPENEVALVTNISDAGARIGIQALEPYYGTGVLIPRQHPAYAAAVAFIAALAECEAQA